MRMKLHVHIERRLYAMQKKRTLWLTIILGTLLTLMATACGSNPSTGATSSGSKPSASTASTPPTVPAEENLYVLDGPASATNGGAGQHIIAFHPGSSSNLTLPVGLFSQDHQRVYTAVPQNGQTVITVTNAHSSANMHTFTIPGTYATAGQNYTTAVISADGRWLALREIGETGPMSTIALVDTQAGKLFKTIQLNGDFDLDAISPDGSRVYLLERLNDQAGHYYVRLYDVSQNQLVDGHIVDKSDYWNDDMSGSALTRQMAKDGTIAYTLYTDTVRNSAFVHILPLAGSYRGARCIDLPAGKTSELLRYYTLALSPDGNTLYAVNSALGVIISIDVGHSDEVFSDNVKATARFNPGTLAGSDKTQALYHGAALSPDQNTLYFVGVHGIWAANTADLKVKSNYVTGQVFTGIALSKDGQTLYAVHPASGVTLVNVASGQSRQVTPCPALTPVGIEWVSN
jgi:DNA-binding beta-propeller fold protein YncE